MKLEFSGRIFEKFSNIGFYKKKNPSGCCRGVQRKRTDRQDNEAICCISELCDNAKENSTFCPQSVFCVDLRANKDYFPTHY